MKASVAGFGYGERNDEGERLLEFAGANGLVSANSFFKKKKDHLITYHSGVCCSQIDYILIH